MENKCTISHKLWVIYILVIKLKSNVQPDTLNFLKHVLFSLTIDRKINRMIDLHI